MAVKIPSGASGRTSILSAAQKTGVQANTGSVANTGRSQQSREDTLELSDEALAALQGEDPSKASEEAEDTAGSVSIKKPLSSAEQRAQDRISTLKYMQQMLDSVKQQNAQMAEQSKTQADALKESMEKMKRCSKIAKNIMKGHKVPPKDEKYLLETDPKLYMMAMAMRMLKDPDNKKVKSELKDEEQQQNEAASGVEGADGEASVDVAVEINADAGVE